MTNAERNRLVGIGMLMELYVPATHDYDLQSTDSAEIANNIRKLAQLGRTARWQAAIDRWARMVQEQGNERGIRWAILQGAVYAGHVVS